MGTEGQLAFLQPSAVNLENLEKISDVQQSLTDVVPKALGILWKPKAQANVQASPCPSVPTNEDPSLARWGPAGAPSSGRSRSRGLTVSELENLLETWKKMVFSPAIM